MDLSYHRYDAVLKITIKLEYSFIAFKICLKLKWPVTVDPLDSRPLKCVSLNPMTVLGYLDHHNPILKVLIRRWSFWKW